MRQYKLGSALLMTMILVGCGGGSDLPAKSKFSSQVSFGDSLSDVGSYKVGDVLAAGGGQFSINGANANGKTSDGKNITNWTEVMAVNLGLPAPCAAWKGLDDGTPTPSGTNVTVVPHSECTGYAQGGARVNDSAGIHNKLADYEPGAALTYPVSQQITEHLARHGNFTGDEIVYVMAGANDLLAQMNKGKKAGKDAATAAVTTQVQLDIANHVCTPTDAQATNCIPGAIATLTQVYLDTLAKNTAGAYFIANQQALGGAMVLAATQLSGYVDNLITAKAKHIVVVNMPDVASTPAVAGTPLVTLVDGLVGAFNTTLHTAVAAKAEVLFVDAYSASKDEVAHPSKYGLENVTSTACNMSVVTSSLACSAATLITPVGGTQLTANAHYLFADDVHPTPYGHNLFAQYVLQAMTAKGWH